MGKTISQIYILLPTFSSHVCGFFSNSRSESTLFLNSEFSLGSLSLIF